MRRRLAQPEPPPLGGIAVDGGNVVAGAPHWLLDRLQGAVDWLRRWRPGLELAVFVDDALLRAVPAAVQGELRAWQERGFGDGSALVLTAAGQPADPELLDWAQQRQALVVSNDRFADHAERRAGLLTLQFAWSPHGFEPFAEATWFRRRGQAVRVPLAALG